MYFCTLCINSVWVFKVRGHTVCMAIEIDVHETSVNVFVALSLKPVGTLTLINFSLYKIWSVILITIKQKAGYWDSYDYVTSFLSHWSTWVGPSLWRNCFEIMMHSAPLLTCMWICNKYLGCSSVLVYLCMYYVVSQCINIVLIEPANRVLVQEQTMQ